MLAKRIIACLDVRDGRVVKGVRFAGHVDCGDPLALAGKYRDDGADEIVIYDITASPDGRSIDRAWLRALAREINIPICVAGGIRSADDAVACLEAGADKVSINSPALERPELISEIADVAGRQCVVVGVDSLEADGDWLVHRLTGRAETARASGRRMLEWVAEAEARGAGEIVLNVMNRDGSRAGYDIAQTAAARAVLSVPLIASGGAGKVQDFVDLFARADVSGALAAGALHRGELNISDVKNALAAAGFEVRPC